MKGSLKGKRILVTAGPTWAALDDVRVISNISSGEMGASLVREALAQGGKVDLLLGPVGKADFGKKVCVKRFRYFQELFDLVKDVLKKNSYDIIIHCAAVSDYLPKFKKGKLSSGKEELVIRLRRAPKIIQAIRCLAPEACVVMFKLELGVGAKSLFKRAFAALKKNKADFIVANTFDNDGYNGFVLGRKKVLAKSRNKKDLAHKLFGILEKDSKTIAL